MKGWNPEISLQIPIKLLPLEPGLKSTKPLYQGPPHTYTLHGRNPFDKILS